MKNIKKRKKFVFAAVLITLAVCLLILPFAVSYVVYQQYFGVRYTTYKPLAYAVEDFPGLNRERMEFPSDRGQMLTGYRYYREQDSVKGVVVMAHGFGGGGHNSYMDCADIFTRNGYDVFAYDATGNDESEGKAVNGLPQGVIDLDYAISYVEEQEVFRQLPVMLFGHSWGGYAVANVLTFHPEVKAVVSLSGFNCSSDLVRSQGEELIGGIVGMMMPYVNLIERIRFGKYAANTAMDGFASSDAGVFIVHSEDDDVVAKKYGYDIYQATYADSGRFRFLSYTNRGHNQIYYDQETAVPYIDRFNQEMKAAFEASGEEWTAEWRANYINEHLNRTVWCNLPDPELFGEIIAFYDSYAR